MLNVTKPHIFLARDVQTKYCKVCRPRVALHCLRDASITNQDKQNTGRDGATGVLSTVFFVLMWCHDNSV